jgi:phosphatidylglycerol:prolipoprotein diacylglycerol transferase
MGGEPVTSYGVFMLFSFLVAGTLLRSEIDREGLDPDRAWDIVFMAVLGGVVGAKIYYVILNYPWLFENPVRAIFSRGGMVWYGGFGGAVLLIIWEIKRRGLPLGKMADLIAPPLAIGYAVGRMGCFLVGDDYGRPTASWVGIRFPQGSPPTRVDVIESHFGIQVDPVLVEQFGQVLPVHPTQLYEVALAILIFIILWKLRIHKYGTGWLWWLCLAMLSLERFLVEFVRIKDDRFLGSYTVAQLIAVLLIVLSVWGMNHTVVSGKKTMRKSIL